MAMGADRSLAAIAIAIGADTWYETEADHRAATAHASDVMVARGELLAIADEMEWVMTESLNDPYYRDRVSARWVWTWLGRIRELCGEPEAKPGRIVDVRP